MTNRISSAKEEAFNRKDRYENAGPVVISPNIKSETCTERTIIKPLKKWLDDPDKKKIAVLTAPTGTGKTFSILGYLIPKLISNGSKLIVLSTISIANQEDLLRDCNEALRKHTNLIFPMITADPEIFRKHNVNAEYACILITTVQSLIAPKTAKIMRKLVSDDKEIVIIRDEGHFGGSSDEDSVELNLSHPHYGTYNASYYKLMSIFLPSGNIQAITFTATPLREMTEEDFPVGKKEYKHNESDPWNGERNGFQ